MSATHSAHSSLNESGPTEFFNPPDSPGSSVSTQLQEEYDELLKYAVIMPSYDPSTAPQTIRDVREAMASQTAATDTQVQTGDSLHHVAGDDEDTIVDEDEVREDGVEGHEQHVGFSTQDSEIIPNDLSSIDGRESIDGGRSGLDVPRLATIPMGDPLATRLFMRSDAESDSQSVSGFSQVGDPDVEYSVAIDQDLGRMEHLLDQWTGDLKRNILAEFGQAKIQMIGRHKKQAMKASEKHAAEIQRLHHDMDSLRELLHTFEASIERKDHVIANLTRGLQKQKEKFDLMKSFSEWRLSHIDAKREVFASKFAEKHHERRIQQKCFAAWHMAVESSWRQRVEKACQAKAQEVCMALTNDYETKIASLNEALELARAEVNRLHVEREQYEETMKKAFMRGVCALNLEAMTMFQDSDNKAPNQDPSQMPAASGSASAPSEMSEEMFYSATVPQEPVFHSGPPGGPPPRVVTSQSADRGGLIVSSKVITAQTRTTSAKSGKGKVVTAKMTARAESGRTGGGLGGNPGLAPPMSSVVVERHQPVTKQTVGHATASRYVRSSDTMSSSLGGSTRPVIVQRKIAGQAVPNQNIQTVKLVE